MYTVQGISERISHILNETGVKVAMKPLKTIDNIFTRLVCKIPCADCDFA